MMLQKLKNTLLDPLISYTCDLCGYTFKYSRRDELLRVRTTTISGWKLTTGCPRMPYAKSERVLKGYGGPWKENDERQVQN